MSAPITLSNVSLFYNEKLILRGFSFSGLEGTLTLVTGANGAGKSSLLRLMAGLERPDIGAIRLRPNLRLAYLGHPTFIYPDLTARQNLAFWAKVHAIANPRAAIEDVLARTGLTAIADERTGSFSRGMAQRLNFSRCLMLEPELFLLDEPFTGLDRDSQAIMRAELGRLRQSGACLYLVSHALAEDSRLADEVFCIRDRRLSRQKAASC